MHSRHFLLALQAGLGIACSSGAGATNSSGATGFGSYTTFVTTSQTDADPNGESSSGGTHTGTDSGTTADGAAPTTSGGGGETTTGNLSGAFETSGASTGSGTPTTTNDGPLTSGPDTTTDPPGGSTTTTTTGEAPGGGNQPPPDNATDENLLVALIGDQGTGSDTKAVYQLILDEKADFVIILGDFDYGDDPDKWASEMESVLGDSFPVFAAIGNHDTDAWPGYQDKLKARLAKIAGASCDGDLGVKSSCTYRGLHFVLSGLGVKGSDSDHEKHLAEVLAADDHLWSLCTFHKNQRDLQAGDKPDDLTWKALQTCQNDGSIIAMAHEHSYARTLTLTDIGNSAAAHGATGMAELLEVGPGRTFSVVSGLGGKSIRDYESGLHDGEDWWGTIYTGNYYLKNGVEVGDFEADHGALFLRFYVGGDPNAAHGYFKNIKGDVIDEFDIVHK
ncbi:metallophosphoesterase [Nannocystis radixulma]|uniref:Metallophosphoesterase n=1 Tax=Nannocystis radixulma TaxID=2995305 RepID=A0ABT5BHQ0_9BACT|nr:metallophosphoesterase [Nannocystis radixulma]MDC0673682.1 metallophosphoesterase [Nannocystis radixulma]